MTNLEILDILDKVFVDQEIYVEPRSKFSVIDIRYKTLNALKVRRKPWQSGTGLRFYTYSDDSSKSDCVWYCGIWIVSESKEIRIPNEMAKEFIQEIYEHTKVVNDINDKVSQIRKRLDEMNNQEAIRDMKLKTILNEKS